MIILEEPITKAFWMGCLFVCIFIYGVGKLLMGLKESPKINIDRYDWGDAIGGAILTIISVGWWFAS